MEQRIQKGDIVRIPQNVTLYHFSDGRDLQTVEEFFVVQKPMAAVYVDDHIRNGFKYKEVLVDNATWYAEEADIHEWRKNASKPDGSI